MKLSDWLTINGISIVRFAEMIEVNHSTVSRYAADLRRPRPEISRRIFTVTDGKVTPNDFMDVA